MMAWWDNIDELVEYACTLEQELVVNPASTGEAILNNGVKALIP